MISPSEKSLSAIVGKVDADKNYLDTFFNELAKKSFVVKARTYGILERSKAVMAEEGAIEDLYRSSYDKGPVVATKITDNIFVVEKLRYEKNEAGEKVPVSYFYPHCISNNGLHSSKSLFVYHTFEEALFDAICHQFGISDHTTAVMVEMLNKLKN